jgi:hypothetical protein
VNEQKCETEARVKETPLPIRFVPPRHRGPTWAEGEVIESTSPLIVQAEYTR